MCGIAGFAGVEGALGAPGLRASVAALHHRGPDDAGTLLAPTAGIGMARLAIVGIDDGHQPIVSEDGRFAIVGNGEIYDAPDHRRRLESAGHCFSTRSDIEALLHLFEEHGTDAFARVNGMFAVAIVDLRTSEVVVARDRLGIKPLFLASVGSATFFASEIPALVAGLPAGADLALDPAALGDLLAHGRITPPRTIHRGIRRLPPGHWQRLGPSGAGEPVAWWTLPELEDADQPFDERAVDGWAAELAALIEDSVRLRTLGDVPAGAFLSGGLDSSAIVAVLVGQVADPVPTFTLGFREGSHDERAIARDTARALGTDHHETLLDSPDPDRIDALFRHLGEPFGDVSILPTDRLAHFARQRVKFVLSGDGADELFGGYAWFLREARLRALPGPVRGAARALSPLLARGQGATGAGVVGRACRALGDLASPSARSFLRRRRLATTDQLASLLHPDLRDAANGPTAMEEHAAGWSGATEAALWLDLDRRFTLGPDILEKVDRATMRHSLEARVPFLDHRIVECAARIPAAAHLGPDLRGKHVLRRAIGRLLPPTLLDRPKRGFGIPVDAWLRGPLRTRLHERLRAPALADAGILDPTSLEHLIERHDRGAAAHGHLLWTLWSLAVWIEEGTAGASAGPANRAGSADLVVSSG